MKRCRRIAAALVLSLAMVAGGLVPTPAEAVCNVTATGISFPPYSYVSAMPTTGTGTITVACDETPPANVTISLSAGTAGNFATRVMRGGGGAGTLEYNVFTTSAMATVWGDGSGGSSPVILNRVRRNEGGRVTTLYGRILPGQNVPVGGYGDSLTATILY